MPAWTNTPAIPTIADYLLPAFSKEVSDRTMRFRILLAKLQADGRVSTNRPEAEFRLPVEWKESTPFNFAAGQVINYAPVNRLKHSVFNIGQYGNTDQITHLETYLAKSPNALVDRMTQIVPGLSKDLAKQLGKDLYVDGNATGNELKLQGFESWAGSSTTVVADQYAKPSDTYGGLVTNVGNYAGTWSTDLTVAPNANIATDWPFGSGTTTYDFHTPKLVNWSSTSWPSGASNTFVNTAFYSIRSLITAISRLGGREDKPNLVIMSSKMFVDFKNLSDDGNRNLLPHEEGRDLGFPTDVLTFDGLMVTHEYDCPDNCFYMLSTNHIEMAVVTPEMIWIEPPAWESGNLSKNFVCGFYGQLMMNPKYMGKGKNYAAS